MIEVSLLFILPFLGLVSLLMWGHRRYAAILNLIFTAATFANSLVLVWDYHTHHFPLWLLYHQQFILDPLNILLMVLTTFIFTTVAYFSWHYLQHNLAKGRITQKHVQLYYVMYQIFLGMMLLVLMTNNIGILWVAMEGATLATVLLVSLYRTPEAIEAAWKYFILCIVGIALALFGTVLIYFAAKSAIADPQEAMLWTALRAHAHLLAPRTVTLAFVFLLVGYGTKVGLVPLHYWLPDAHSESPAPMSALLSGLLLNIGVYALVRFEMIVNPALPHPMAGRLMMILGLLSFIVAVILMYRQKNIKRMLSYSSIEHMGLITFAFGIGTVFSAFVGLFYMIIHSLVKSALFMSVGHVIQLTQTQAMDKIRGLLQLSPVVGVCLFAGIVAIAGFPPFALFNSELLLLMSAVQVSWWIGILLFVGLLIACAGLFRHLQPMVYGKATTALSTSVRIHFFPVALQLGVALVLAFYVPPFLLQSLNQAAQWVAG
jgi:hydrogenase-4 component F